MSMSSPELPPEPGLIIDLTLGVPGDPVPLPDDDGEHDEPTIINDEAEDD